MADTQVQDAIREQYGAIVRPGRNSEDLLRTGELRMTRAFALLLLLASAVATVNGQDPYTVAPQAYRKQFENDRVRVTRVHYGPNETIAEHAHPGRPSMFIYLNDGGPVAFRHQHGESGTYAATRPATKAGAYRLAAGRDETHIVENKSDLPSDFLQVEIKIPIDAKSFSGRRFRDPAEARQNFTRVEFENAQVRITRIGCVDGVPCRVPSSEPGLVVSLSTGDTRWIDGGDSSQKPTLSGELLVLAFK